MGIRQATAEYRTLRDTIRERGTRRVTLFWAGLTTWAVLRLAAQALDPDVYLTLVSLAALAAAFEAVYALHVSVERIGRYLQVFYEETGTLPAWEYTAMALGRGVPAGATDPLFSRMFGIAAVLNLAPGLLAAPPVPLALVLLAHLLFGVRLLQARRYAARQREQDLRRFQELHKAVAGVSPEPSSRTAH